MKTLVYLFDVIVWYLVDYPYYLLDDSNADKDYGNYFTRCWCRFSKHKCGVIFYNVAGLEPDTHCKNCGEDIG